MAKGGQGIGWIWSGMPRPRDMSSTIQLPAPGTTGIISLGRLTKMYPMTKS